MILTALLLSLLAPQQSDWPYFGGKEQGDVGIAVDPSSVKRDGTSRTFLAKMTSKGDERYAMVTMRADCSAKTLNIVHSRMFVGGKMVAERDEADGGYAVTEDPTSAPAIAYACAR
jgi:hypothetical protein